VVRAIKLFSLGLFCIISKARGHLHLIMWEDSYWVLECPHSCWRQTYIPRVEHQKGSSEARVGPCCHFINFLPVFPQVPPKFSIIPQVGAKKPNTIKMHGSLVLIQHIAVGWQPSPRNDTKKFHVLPVLYLFFQKSNIF
jgi:hypothetical protein